MSKDSLRRARKTAAEIHVTVEGRKVTCMLLNGPNYKFMIGTRAAPCFGASEMASREGSNLL